MATFSLGTSGVTPGAPGVYINERPGNIAFGEVSSFSTVYMLVETDENVSTTTFPFNTPTPITSLADYRVLCGGLIPDSGIPLLSYQCVNAFFQNAQVGDLRVVRVGTPNQIVEIELLPSGSKINTTALPSALMAGDKVYVQMIINGMRLVAGDGTTGYTANGEWLGVPVTIPVDYVAGDEVNNRKISAAIVAAVSEAIQTNPAVSSAVVVRDFGLLVDFDPVLYANSQDGYVNISSSVFDGNVSVITEVQPVGANYVFMQNTYTLNNIVGGGGSLERIPQDYIQCIQTAFDGQQDQGYLITPGAYAQFDAEGRAAVGAAAADHCASNNYKWMALADPGPYYVTGINKYKNFTPHPAAADFITGMKYLVDNAIYEWTGTDVTYDKATYQSIVSGSSAQVAVQESTNTVAPSTYIGLLDSGNYAATSTAGVSDKGVYTLDSTNFWPVTLPIQKVVLSGASSTTNDLYPYNGTEVYVVAPSYTPLTTGSYPGTATQSFVYLAPNASTAASILNQVNAAGGTAAALAGLPPTGAILPQTGVGTGSTFTLSYADAAWDLPVTINGQTSDLIENITANPAGVNTLHLPGTLQDPTNTYRLAFVSRTILNPAVGAIGGISPAGSVGPIATLGSLVGGSGYVPGTYVGVNLLGGAGAGAVATIVVDITGQVSSVAITTAGAGYFVGDILSAADSSLGAGGGSGFTIRITTVSGQVNNKFTGAVNFNVANHGLANGQKVFFNQPILAGQTQLIKNSTKLVQNAYWVTIIDTNNFVLSKSLTDYTATSYVQYVNQPISSLPVIFYSNVLGGAVTASTLADLITIPLVRARKYAFDSSSIFNQSANSLALAPSANNPGVSIYFNNSSVVLGQELISPFGEDYTTAGWLPSLNLPSPTTTPVAAVDNAYCVPTVDQNYQSEAFMVPAINAIAGGAYDPTIAGAIGPVGTFTFVGGSGYSNGTYTNVPVSGGTGYGATFDLTIVGGAVTACTLNNAGWGYSALDTLTVPGIQIGSGTLFSISVTLPVVATAGSLTAATAYVNAAKNQATSSSDSLQAARSTLVGVYFTVGANGFAPDGVTPVSSGDFLSVAYDGVNYSWVVTPPVASGGDLTSIGQVCYWSQVEMVFTPEQTPPANLWRFDAVTSTELIDNALRGVGFNGVPQAMFVDAGVDNVNRLYDDSQRYFNPFGFIAYYGPWIDSNPDAEEIWLPPSPYVTGVAVRRYRAEGYQFPPAGVKYQLAGAYKAQIPINSAQQNLLNPDGCNAIRTLPGYPQTSVFIWGGRTRVNTKDAQQKLYQFVNTRVILNVVYGSLRSAFDNQIFNVIDGFGVIYNQIISVGNSILNQLYVKGALFGARPSDAFQVICDARINPPADLENGIVNAKVFVTPVPTLERIQIDLIRVAIGQMQNELDSQGLGTNQGGPISAFGQ